MMPRALDPARSSVLGGCTDEDGGEVWASLTLQIRNPSKEERFGRCSGGGGENGGEKRGLDSTS